MNLKITITAVSVILLSLVVIVMPGSGQDEPSEDDLRVFEGMVTNISISDSALTVKGAVEITFPVSSSTKLMRDVNDIKLSDIKTGDYVTVEYYRHGDESRVPLEVTQITLEYGKSDDGGWRQGPI